MNFVIFILQLRGVFRGCGVLLSILLTRFGLILVFGTAVGSGDLDINTSGAGSRGGLL